MTVDLFWRYVRIQLFVLLCGIVGPIFIVMYFVTANLFIAGGIPWLLWAGIAITVLDVVIAVGLTFAGAQNRARSSALEETGVLALARIMSIGETGTYVNNKPLVKLHMRIEGPEIAPFDVEDKVLGSFDRMGNFNARKVVVVVDPATRKFHIDWQRSALVNGLVPAQFTVSDDNRTYDLTGQAGPLMEILQLLKAYHIPVDRMVDVRSNPALKQQLQDIVRRAQPAGAPPPPAAAPVQQPAATPSFVKPPDQSIAQRLRQLETLRANGAVTEAEYAAKREQIISEI